MFYSLVAKHNNNVINYNTLLYHHPHILNNSNKNIKDDQEEKDEN